MIKSIWQKTNYINFFVVSNTNITLLDNKNHVSYYTHFNSLPQFKMDIKFYMNNTFSCCKKFSVPCLLMVSWGTKLRFRHGFLWRAPRAIKRSKIHKNTFCTHFTRCKQTLNSYNDKHGTYEHLVILWVDEFHLKHFIYAERERIFNISKHNWFLNIWFQKIVYYKREMCYKMITDKVSKWMIANWNTIGIWNEWYIID